MRQQIENAIVWKAKSRMENRTVLQVQINEKPAKTRRKTKKIENKVKPTF